MRISTQQIYQGSVQRMQDITVQQNKTQEQLSTGKRVNRPSDDPVAASRILQLDQELARTEQYQRNIDFAENRLEQEDSTLGSVNGLLVRVRELTVQAGNGSLTKEDRSYIAAELKQRLGQLASLANSQDTNGQFVFAGFTSDSPAYVQESGAWTYKGDEGQRLLEVDSGVRVPISDNGKRIFEDIPAAQTFAATTADGSTAITGTLADRALFEAAGGRYPAQLEITFTSPTTYTVTSTYFDPVTNANVTVPLDSDPDPLATNTAFTYVAGQTDAVGLAFTASGEMNAPATFIASEVPVKQGMMTSLENLISGLENYSSSEAGKSVFRNVVATALENLDNGQAKVLEVRAEIGARLNIVESTRDFLADTALLTEGVLSDVRDLDYAEAISRFTQQNNVLQAAQQTFSRVSQLSLFDRL